MENAQLSMGEIGLCATWGKDKHIDMGPFEVSIHPDTAPPFCSLPIDYVCTKVQLTISISTEKEGELEI